MSISHDVKGDKLVITVDLTAKPTRSKSAVEKALAKGGKLEDVPETLIATSGGFMRAGAAKFSLNVMTA